MATLDLPTKDLDSRASEQCSLVSDGRLERAGQPTEAVEAEEELAQGESVGRYSVLSCLGRGGMGVVYKAYDPQLDRNVALKLLRRGRASMQAELRLLREAQTLAKLKHPNVVAVYDAGLAHHGVFIAMELLAGKTVSEWLEEKTRSVQEILEVFRAAGRGLVAAHDAGFVHRDFKPSNVLVEDDGAVRVVDFGLAYALDEGGGEPGGSAVAPDVPLADARMSRSGRIYATEAGTLVGTPAFMAPEQVLGTRGDHRSEQFAFAMSLYVALYDRSPLAGETYDERRATIEQGVRIPERALERSASGERVPPRVRQVIVRGLASDPNERFGSMAELLAQLEEPPSHWGRLAIVGFTLMAGFGVGAVVFDESPKDEPCAESWATLEGTWGPDERAALEAKFAEGSDRTLASAGPRVRAQLDRYAADWVRMYDESCRATFVHRQQSERLFDQRMGCLERRRNRLRSTIDALLEAKTPKALLERTVIPFQLPGLEACADLEAVMAGQPLPEDPQTRERIGRLRERIDEADTHKESGDFERGIAIATEAVSDARALGYRPVLAEALKSLGGLQLDGASAHDAEQTLREAIMVAAEAKDARTEAAAWTDLLFGYVLQGRGQTAIDQELAARAAVARADDDVVRSWMLNSLGALYSERGDSQRSRELLREALEVKQEALGAGHVDVGISWYNLGYALVAHGALDEARDAFEQARAIFEATVGDAHPLYQHSKGGLCRVEQAQGNAAAAMVLCSEVLAYIEATAQAPSWRCNTAFTLAQAQWSASQHEQARRTAEQARRYSENPMMTERIDRWLADPSAFGRGEAKDETEPPESGEL
ncbi:serine/threonine-protein kinase [Paraliomyxa miuraensis]|uniref:serine/threonine-protein kinase n=1 Tax=Paraliomyxa miuraensis TaxID=376150 RepID=UPI00224CD969|nr:serine/threonine-protein kinase [Paraliomyxa miuraensis]MCX4242123.1 serine/threonine-protein kinase [Paraliomyxa miuraensis]